MFVSDTTRMYGCGLLHLVMVLSYCSGNLLCPKIAELGSTVNLTCIKRIATHAHSYSTPIGTTAATCDLSNRYCINLGDFAASVLNESSTILTIPRLLQTYAGAWACVADADDPKSEKCHLTVEKSPSCRIISPQNTRHLSVGEELSLTVYVRSFYCSELVLIGVKTGNTTSHIINGTVSNVTDSTENMTFNMTASHFGDVTLEFSCGTKNHHEVCEGIQSLAESVTTGPTTQTAFTNTTTTQRGSIGDGDDTVVIVLVAVLIPIAIFTISMLVLLRRSQIRHTSHRSKKYVNVHYLSNAEAGRQFDSDRFAKHDTDLQVGKDDEKAKQDTDLEVGKDGGKVKHDTDIEVGNDDDGKAKHDTDIEVGKCDGRPIQKEHFHEGKCDGSSTHKADLQ
ncbi:uncharacterized protein [Haliotis asinina]|uniref:uncharacterized protein n=1 Tax=Haliotis asinina TaxID=109174 RepID=UPI0035326460